MSTARRITPVKLHERAAVCLFLSRSSRDPVSPNYRDLDRTRNSLLRFHSVEYRARNSFKKQLLGLVKRRPTDTHTLLSAQ